MLHVTTEIGVPGKQERERRHFPHLYNEVGIQKYHPRGRRYMPHGNDNPVPFRPHPHYVSPKYTENGLDWSSQRRWIPSPKPENYRPEPEIWPHLWKSLRAFPSMSQRTNKEWVIYPESQNTTLRCSWSGVHKASGLSCQELNDAMLLGNGRKMYCIDKRNGIPYASPGDKNYQAVEYSSGFHKLGSTRPVVDFGGNVEKRSDTFVPLEDIPFNLKTSFYIKEMKRKNNDEIRVVENLERWRPATPLMSQTAVILDDRKFSAIKPINMLTN